MLLRIFTFLVAALTTAALGRGMEWYTKTFNLRYSDVQEHELPGGKVEAHSAFFRLDRGAEYVDHRMWRSTCSKYALTFCRL